ncbi:uncharacterized protein [Drosophila virilis]|uniref:Lipase domain-containing protein n=1 Tax=Drosophila virilis TaxID=7244 RepID=B4LSN1_DROVI|nr:uncharacterized protein LOC6627962 [Drosophila virilis]EDW63770.2 uncharacterized protein Dvir_GJ16514 [Drosophila virilis]
MIKLWLLLGFFSFYFLLEASANSTLISPKCKIYPPCFRVQHNVCPNSNISFVLHNNETLGGRQLNPANSQDFPANTKRMLTVLLHSFASNLNTAPIPDVRARLLAISTNNIISVDYSKLVFYPCFSESVHNADFASVCIAEYLGVLLRNKLVLSNEVLIIGFGLGIHVGDYVAKMLSDTDLKERKEFANLDRSLTAKSFASNATNKKLDNQGFSLKDIMLSIK